METAKQLILRFPIIIIPILIALYFVFELKIIKLSEAAYWNYLLSALIISFLLILVQFIILILHLLRR